MQLIETINYIDYPLILSNSEQALPFEPLRHKIMRRIMEIELNILTPNSIFELVKFAGYFKENVHLIIEFKSKLMEANLS